MTKFTDSKEVAKAVRKHIRQTMPGFKASVTLGRGCTMHMIHIDLMEGPADNAAAIAKLETFIAPMQTETLYLRVQSFILPTAAVA